LSVQPNEFKETTKSSSIGAQFADGSIIISGTNAAKAEDMPRL
jgi:hypothetical protein